MSQGSGFDMYPVKFEAVPMERIWGGNALKPMFRVNSDKPIGEYWVVSGHPNGESKVTEGPLSGMTLNELTKRYPSAYLGQSPQPRFPLLVKFLEAEADLSVQIHPDDAYARANEDDFGKTEAWVVLDAKADGKVNYGHTFGSRAEYETAVKDGRVRDYLSYRPVKQGDLVFVPARTLHALLAGTKVLEIQQTSDVTYRVYDWDRLDANLKPRQLHVEKAADVLEYGTEPPLVHPVVLQKAPGLTITRLVECNYFTIDACHVEKETVIHHGHPGNPDIAIVVDGEGTLHCDADGSAHELALKPGDAVLIPGDLTQYRITPKQPLTVIRTFY